MSNNDYKADCGHTVDPDDVIHKREISLCPACYQPFDLDEWPERLGKHTHRVIEGGMGVGARTNRHTNVVYLLGLDKRGRARYHDEENRRVKTFVPMNDYAYRDDRIERGAKVSGWQTTNEHEPTLVAERYRETKPEPAPAIPGDFVTLPNGDHIVMVDCTERVHADLYGFGDWLDEHKHEFKQLRDSVLERYDITFEQSNDQN